MVQNVLQLDFHLGAAQSYQNLTLYPLLGSLNGHLDYLTLEEALNARSIEIREAGRGTVSELWVTNHADRDVLIIGGEELVGALQNRANNASIMVAARSSLQVPVSCTERGRWHVGQSGVRMRGISDHISSVQTRQVLTRSVSDSLKKSGSYHSDQAEIWASIGDTLTDFGVTSHTSAQSDLFEEKGRDLEDYLGSFHLSPDQAGMVAMIHGEILSLDLFGKADTFSRIFPRLLRSYALEAIRQKGAPGPRDGDIAGFIQDLKAARARISLAGAKAQPPAPEGGYPGGPSWSKGEVILGDFEVEGWLGKGGMGVVHLVRSRSTGERFAVKRTTLRSEKGRRAFLSELQTWIDLPGHPHLTACRFFRTVGDEVVIFAEYVEGGSLSEWIRGQEGQPPRLYEGGPERALERMLDVAIQFAWGLHAAHELGLVHQDVKPGNVLMTAEGLAKVADFGLARARVQAGEEKADEAGAAGGSLLASWGGGMTRAYCSPEQAEAAAQARAGVPPERRTRLSRKTDLWNWGVSVLEMFTGGLAWQSGAEAAGELEAYLREGLAAYLRHVGIRPIPGIPPMSEAMAEVLRRCFRREPSERWADMAEVAEILQGVYRETVSRDYLRPEPALPDRSGRPAIAHDRRTTTGVQWTDPREWLIRALEAEGRDPAEAEALLPPRTGSRKVQAIADLAAYEEARQIFERLVAAGRKDLQTQLAALCMEKAFIHENAEDTPGALALYDRAIAIYERLVEQEGRKELANDLAMTYQNKAIALQDLGELGAAAALYDRAIEIYERLVNREGRAELRGELAWCQARRAYALLALGERARAFAEARRAIAVLEEEVRRTGRADLQSVLTWAKDALKEVL